MSEEKIYLDIKDLEVVYSQAKKTVRAVNRVSLKLVKGKTLGLVGETGAGKTTIAKSIMRILPNPQAKVLCGQIFLDGEDLLEKSEDDMYDIRGTKVAMVFQDPMTALNPLMTVGDQILEVLMLHNDYNYKEGLKKAGEMLETVGIPAERCPEYPHQFSGGMKQRVVIAMALACNPELLLADEPTTALDVTIQAQVLDLIKELKESYNTSMLLITHDLGIVAEICDDVAVIYAGKIVESGSKEDVFDRTAHPYTLGLFGSLPSVAMGEKRLHPIGGMPPDPTNLPPGCAFWPRCPYATEECKEEIRFTNLSPGHYCRCIHSDKAHKALKRKE
jgi:peptide/nickel transport system ATP-binding protein